MSVRLRRPSPAELEKLLSGCQRDEPTYEPMGISMDDDIETSLHRSRWEAVLEGDHSFERGSEAIRTWAVHRGAGLSVVSDGVLAVGTNVAMAAPLPVGFVEVTCRVVAVVDGPDEFGFAYGTLSVHPERGEESFMLRRSADGTVRFVVAATSQPAHPLARLAPPIANRLQDQASRRYLAAMKRATGSG